MDWKQKRTLVECWDRERLDLSEKKCKDYADPNDVLLHLTDVGSDGTL